MVKEVEIEGLLKEVTLGIFPPPKIIFIASKTHLRTPLFVFSIKPNKTYS